MTSLNHALVAVCTLLAIGTAAKNTTCLMKFGDTEISFDTCAKLKVSGAVMEVFRDNSTNGRTKYGVTIDKDGYCGLGFGSVMTGTTAVVAGFSKPFVLAKSGTLSASTDAKLAIDNVTSAKKTGDHTSVTWTKISAPGDSEDLIWAWGTNVGPVLGGGATQPNYHDSGIKAFSSPDWST